MNRTDPRCSLTSRRSERRINSKQFLSRNREMLGDMRTGAARRIIARLLEKSWAFTENDLALGVQMLHHARNKYPWFEMHTLYPFDKTGVRTAVVDAMAMRTVKSTIFPFPHLLEA